MTAPQARPLKLLVLSPFPAYDPPRSGAEQRLLHLHRALAARRHCDITLLAPAGFGARREVVHHAPGLREIRIPRDRPWRTAHATLERAGLEGDLSGLAFALAAGEPGCALRQEALRLAPEADLVVHDSPWSAPVFADAPPPAEIYNAAPAPGLALLSSLVTGPGLARAFERLRRLEGGLARRCRLVLAPSDRDAELLRLAYGLPSSRLAVCPNGFDEAEFAPIRAERARPQRRPNPRPRLLFTGSETRANLDAARFLMRDLAPALPEMDIVLAGGVCEALGEAPGAPPNLILAGPFDEEQKRALLVAADAFLHPAVEGPGAPLKAVEALAAGLPLISTPAGLRGLPARPGVEALAAERAAFAETVRGAMADPAALARIAEAGAALARDRLAWSGIADALAARLRRALAAPDSPAPAAAPPEERPLLLAFNDYAVAGAPFGGAQRIREALGALGRALACDIALLCFGEAPGATLVAPGFLQVTVAPGDRHRAFQRAVNALAPVSANDIVAGLFCAANRGLVALAADLARRCAAVVLEHCYMAPLLDAVFPEGCPVPVIYSAHNVEAQLKPQLLAGHPLRAELADFAARAEAALTRRADLVVACSAEDAAHFAAAGARRTLLVPHGCSSPDAPAATEARAPAPPGGDGLPLRVGFMGSAHPPNVEAARFILEALAPAFPEARFELLGEVCTALGEPGSAPNLRLHGILDEAAKSAVLRTWDVALNPLASGGGASLKVPEYLAHGLATVCTPEGARGVALAEAEAGIVVPRSRFAEALAALLADAPRRRALGERAARHARERLSWPAACEPYAQALRDLLHRAPPRPPQPERRLLIVTHRYGEPAPGEAGDELIQLAARLRPHFTHMDLAAIAVAELTEHMRFAWRAAPAEGGASAALGDLFDRAAFFAPDAPSAPDAEARCRRLAQAWLEEGGALLRSFLGRLALAGRPMLVGGFHDPESAADGAPRRWTAARFQALLPPGSRVVELAGWSPRAKALRLRILPASGADAAAAADAPETPSPPDSVPLEAAQHFVLRFALPPAGADAPLLLSGEVEPHTEPGDPRPLGIRLERLSVLRADPAAAGDAAGDATAGGLRPVLGAQADLAEDVEAELRAHDFESWAAAVLALARTRRAEAEEDFAALCGPRSAALQDWLRRHARDYDAILVQGAPTDPAAPQTVQTLAALDGPHRPRLVLLPPFRGDDRLDYWRHHLDAFARADRTLLVSRTVAGLLGGGDRLAVVPGGGVDTSELAPPDAVARFREAAPPDLREPFFLVLGREGGPPQGCGRVARAVRALRTAGRQVALVVIGPEPDALAAAAAADSGVHALGRQRREVVLGALAQCLGVVSMSAHERFGAALCEAWKLRKPVVANRACLAFRELVEDGATGLLVETDAELEEALARLLGDAALRDRLGAAGFAAVTRRHTWPMAARAVARALIGADRAEGGDDGAGPPGRPLIPATPGADAPSFAPGPATAALLDSHSQVTEFEAVGLKRRFTFVVPAGFLAAERDRRLALLPRGEWESDPTMAAATRRRIAASITGEILREAVEAAFRREVHRRGLRPAEGPAFELLGGGAGGDLRLRVSFEVLPRITIPDLSGIAVERLTAEPDEAEVTAALEALARRHGALRDALEDHRAAPGDIVLCDLSARIGTVPPRSLLAAPAAEALLVPAGAPDLPPAGQADLALPPRDPLPAFARTDVPVEIGTDADDGPIPGLAERLADARRGETRVFDALLPDPADPARAPRRRARIRAVVKAIRRPVADDALARRLGLPDLAALRARLRAALRRRYDARAQARQTAALMEALADRLADVPVPSALVAAEEDRLRQAAAAVEEAPPPECRSRAERNVRVALLLTEIARSSGIEVADAELEIAMRREAARHPGAEAQVMAHFRASPAARDALRTRILEEKTTALVLRQVRVTERRVPAAVLAPPPHGAPPRGAAPRGAAPRVEAWPPVAATGGTAGEARHAPEHAAHREPAL